MIDIPLATELRPEKIDDIVGQKHLLGEDKILRKSIEDKMPINMILYGRPGTGKTSIAEVISNETDKEFIKYNGTDVSVKQIREAGKSEGQPVLCIDEVYRLSKSQQDVLLPIIEDGSVVFIGCTTENPFHSLRGALVSRCHIFQLEPLSRKELYELLVNAKGYLEDNDYKVEINPDAAEHLVLVSCGDGRKLLSLLELALYYGGSHINKKIVEELAPSKYYKYDKDFKYDAASMYQGAIQASDPDAAIWALAKWLESGEDLKYIARRMIVSCSEDASGSPEVAAIAHNAYLAACEIGRPEADIVLAHATVAIASAPRDKSAAYAIWGALKDVRNKEDVEIPKEMRDSHYDGAEKLDQGQYKDGGNMDAYVGINKKYYHKKT